jgi:hypothetical protein
MICYWYINLVNEEIIMKKKLLIALGLTGIIALSVSVGAYAATAFKVTVNGKTTKLDVKVINKVNYVPLNEFAVLLGQDVKTDIKTNVITITKKATPTPTPKPTKVSGDRVDFKSAEHIAASKASLAKDYPDSFTTQKMLQDAAVKSQKELETLVNGLTDAEWAALKGSYDKLVSDYNDSPTTVLMLFKSEIDSYRKIK